MTRRDFLKIMGYTGLISSVPSYGGIYPQGIRGSDDNEEMIQCGSDTIRADMARDKTLRKQLIKDSLIKECINPIEKIVADKSRIFSDEIKETYQVREYNTCCFYPNDKGEFVIKDEAIWVYDEKYRYSYQDGGILPDIRLTETIYNNKTLKDIYHLKQVEFINLYSNDEEYGYRPLSYWERIYPAKMPTKDYFPFEDFDCDTRIPLMLTEAEKQRYKESLDSFSNYDIDSYSWYYCILWIDSHRIFINLECESYYFKQVGKNLHFFEIMFQCV